jgi:protein O-GlcNAc transferase
VEASREQAGLEHARKGEEHFFQGRLRSAIQEFECALAGVQDWPQVLHFLATAYLGLGRPRTALKYIHEAHRQDPDAPELQARLLLTLLYLPDAAPEDVFLTYRQWGEQFNPVPALPLPALDGRIRVGYFSSSFCTNADVFFLEPILRHHDRQRYELFCYSLADRDAWTERIEKIPDHWRDLAAIGEAEWVSTIRSDNLHILVDCSGHFAGPFLRVFAAKPAPIQVSLSIYPATTGLRTLDYRITDGFVDPEGMTDHFYTERLIRLPRLYCCYQPAEDSPAVSESPVERNGYVTFGAFHRPEKTNPQVFDLWARIMSALPDAQLFFHHVYGGSREPGPEYCSTVARDFSERGIDSRRISFAGIRALREHQELYRHIDIMLDTFPYTGMTTVSESMWMGVPTVTMTGRSHASRAAAALLHAAGLTDWIAQSTEEYFQLAVTKASDPRALAGLRSRLREQMRCSPVTDCAGYTRSLEGVYEEIIARGRAGLLSTEAQPRE